MSTLYESIDSLCKERGIKGGKMCVDIGISKTTMTDLKSGRRTGISMDTARKIADYFGVSVDRVLGAEQKEKSPTPDGAGLDEELFIRLCQLTPDEIQKVDAFVQGILATR